MDTIHNQVYTQILSSLLSNNFEALAALGSCVDNGEGAPPGVFEPWMRTEVSCWAEGEPGQRVAYIMFRAGPFNAPFQETLAYVAETDLTAVTLQHTIPGDEYRLCEVVQFMVHLVIAQQASLQKLPSCCCPSNPDGSVHEHPEFVTEVPEAEVVNISVASVGKAVSDPEAHGLGRGNDPVGGTLIDISTGFWAAHQHKSNDPK